MAAFAVSEDLRLFLQLPSIDDAAATALLEQASDVIRAEVMQQIDLVTDDTVTLDGVGGTGTARTAIVLPELPLVEVTSVVEDGVALVAGTDYSWTVYGTLTRTGQGWGTSLQVTYTHGWGTVPPYVKAVCVQVAARAWVNPRGLQQKTLGPKQEGYAKLPDSLPGDLVLTPYQQRLLDPLRP